MSSNSSHGTTTENEGNAANRGVHVVGIDPPAPTPLMPLYAKSRALVIGIDAYRDANNQLLAFSGGVHHFDDLHNAKNDAKAVAKLLREEFDFEDVTELYDEQATKDAIEEFLRDYLPGNADLEDRIVIFFAGHGHTQEGIGPGVGHLLTYGASSFAKTVSMTDLISWFYAIPAKHILLLLDCCFSGHVAYSESLALKPIRSGGDYLARLVGKKSWQVLAAGGTDELVADSSLVPNHSAFTAALLTNLGGAAAKNQDGVIIFSDVAERVKEQVVEETRTSGEGQEPVYRQILKGEPGNTVFLTRQRRLQDELSRELIGIVGHPDKALEVKLAHSFEMTCRAYGKDVKLLSRELSVMLAELWGWGTDSKLSSAILGFVEFLERQQPDLSQKCKEWREKAEDGLALQWLGPLPMDIGTGMPILTVSLDPVKRQPGPSPTKQRQKYKVSIYFWYAPCYLLLGEELSMGQVQTSLERVLQEIEEKFPDQSSTMTIEFCVPVDLLSAPFEQWTKPIDSIIPQRVVISEDYSVVVRCIQGLKLRTGSRWENWQRNWKHFLECRNTAPASPNAKIYRNHEQPNLIGGELIQQPNIHFWGLTSLPKDENGIPVLFARLLEAAIPIAIWPRSIKDEVVDEDSIYEVIDHLLHEPLNGLPARVQFVRSHDPNDIARRLILFWDAYDRIPPHIQPPAYSNKRL